MGWKDLRKADLFFIFLITLVGYCLVVLSVVIFHFNNDSLLVILSRFVAYIKETLLPIGGVLLISGPFLLNRILRGRGFLQILSRCSQAAILVAAFTSAVFFYSKIFPEGSRESLSVELLQILLEGVGTGILYALPALVVTCLTLSLLIFKRIQ